MAALIEAINVKRKMFFEFEDTPYHCLDVEISTPTARGGQTLVRLKMRNLITRAVFDKTFKASDKFKEPDLQMVQASYLYSDGDGSHFMDQESFETLTLNEEMVGDALDFLVEGAIIQIQKFNGNPIGLQLPTHVELAVTYTEPGARGDTASGNVTKPAKLETGIEIRVPLFIKEGEKVKVATETREFAGRAMSRKFRLGQSRDVQDLDAPDAYAREGRAQSKRRQQSARSGWPPSNEAHDSDSHAAAAGPGPLDAPARGHPGLAPQPDRGPGTGRRHPLRASLAGKLKGVKLVVGDRLRYAAVPVEAELPGLRAGPGPRWWR